MLTISPAVEKTLSLGTEVAGTERNAFAREESSGYSFECSFHHLSGQFLREMDL